MANRIDRRPSGPDAGGARARRPAARSLLAALVGLAGVLLAGAALAQTGTDTGADSGTDQAAQTAGSPDNRGVVELETGSSSGISVRIAEDLADVVDDGATRRVLPVVGKGGLQNIIDLRLLHGIDLAIVQADVLDYARQQHLFPGLTSSITYVTKLYNEEFHLLARADIKSIDDLADQKVNVDVRGGGTAITAARLFHLLNLHVTTTNDDDAVALARLRKGEIAALAYVAGKPAPLFRGIGAGNGLHFLAIPLNPAVTAVYVPTRLTASDYPGLVAPDHPIDTIAVGTVLAAANLAPLSDRYRNVANFVDTFFTQFQTLLEPGHHPKWSEVNLAADLPGWRRFPPAAQWLKRNAATTSAASPADMRTSFERFLDERLQATGGTAMTQQQKDDLFTQFERWQAGQAH